MSKVRVKVNVDSAIIKSQLRKDEKFSQGVRLFAVYQIALGKKSEELEELYSTSHKSICNWVHRYNSEGVEGLKDRHRSGRQSRLKTKHKMKLKEVVLQSPEKQGFASGVWTWALISEYIKREFSVEYKKAQIYNILHSLGFSYQKGKGYFPETADREATVEAIKKKLQSRNKKSVVLFEDEASLSNTATVSYSWSLKGQQPNICQPQSKRERKTIFGAVNPYNGDLLECVEDKGNTKSFFRFVCQCLKANKGKKVYMVLDNVRFHHAKRLKPVLERYKHRIEFVFLPPYSPDLNPIERVWWLMRKQITHNRWVKTLDERIQDFEQWCNTVGTSKIKNVCNLIENIY
jgi:putative transposase